MKTLKNNIALYALIIGLFLTFSYIARAQDVPDGFNPNANGTVDTIAVQADGKILIGGVFTRLNGGTVTRNYIARLNTDGTVDTTFNPNANGIVFSITVQTDGKILIGGNFTTLNGGAVSRNYIARLNADGTVDTAFDPNANDGVLSIAVQADGKILIGGFFTRLNGGAVTRNHVARVNADGTVDTAFDPNADNFVYSIAVQADGKILIGGTFTRLNGGAVTRNRVARLNSDGTVDSTFDLNAGNSVRSITVQTDGKILIGGDFTTLNSGAVSRGSIVRLNSDGTVDSTFDPNSGGAIYSVAVQTDGKILIGGNFSTLNGGAATRNHIARLGFAPTAASVSVSGRVRTPNGKGLTNAFVTLTDSSGNRRLARTSAFGYFHFEDVAAGETYIVQVFSKRYRFASQVLSINQDITDLELTGENLYFKSLR